jgi:hypothetical protein
MDTMHNFYASLSSDKLRDTYLKILADLTKLNREQIRPLESDEGWQEWSAEKVTQAQVQA